MQVCGPIVFNYNHVTFYLKLPEPSGLELVSLDLHLLLVSVVCFALLKCSWDKELVIQISLTLNPANQDIGAK